VITWEELKSSNLEPSVRFVESNCRTQWLPCGRWKHDDWSSQGIQSGHDLRRAEAGHEVKAQCLASRRHLIAIRWVPARGNRSPRRVFSGLIFHKTATIDFDGKNSGAHILEVLIVQKSGSFALAVRRFAAMTLELCPEPNCSAAVIVAVAA